MEKMTVYVTALQDSLQKKTRGSDRYIKTDAGAEQYFTGAESGYGSF
jgi:hypothetical protein